MRPAPPCDAHCGNHKRGIFAVGYSMVYGRPLARTLALASLILVVGACAAPGVSPSPPVPATAGPAGPTSTATTAAAESLAPSPDLTPVPAAAQADLSAIRKVAAAFVDAEAQGDYDAAWALMSPEARSHFRGFEDFASERAAFMQSARHVATVGDPTNAPDRLATWLLGLSTDGMKVEEAYLVEVDFPKLDPSTNGSTQVLIIAPDMEDQLRVWIVR